MLARVSSLCCKALAYCPLLVPVLVIIGHQRPTFGVSLRFPFFPRSAITSIMLNGMLCAMLIDLIAGCWGGRPGPESGLRGLTVDPSCKIIAEHVGRLHPDVMVNGKDRISARLTFLKPEMSLR